MDKQLLQTIQNVGFSRKEAKVYLASLQIGEGTTQKIAQKAAMPRTTVYQILEKLKQKGWVSSYSSRGVLHYEAVNPRYLLRLLQEKTEDFAKVIPELDAQLFAGERKPSVRFFEGHDGIISVLEDLLSEGKKEKIMYTIAPLDIFEKLPRYFPRFVEQRVKNDIKQQVIIVDTPLAKAFKQKNADGKELREVKILPKEFTLTTDETVCGNKIFAFPVQKEKFALVIESKEMAKTRKQLFNFIWGCLQD